MAFAAVLALWAGDAQTANRITLIVPDAPAHIPNAAGQYDKRLTQTTAAERLQMLIERATGVRPDIVPAAQAPETGTRIFVGYGPHLEGKVTPPGKPEGLKIQERGGSLYLLGEIAPKGTNNWPGPVDRGLMHAVETYAERGLGYRFLFSTPDDEKTFELGTVVPKIANFTIETGLLVDESPAFQHRVTSSKPRNLMGLRSGSAPAFFCNHSYGMPWWSASFGKAHPEMFIPLSAGKGKAGDEAAKAMESQPNLSFLDYTEPRVLEKRLEQLDRFLKEGKAGGFYYSPILKYAVEEPPDTPAPSVQYNERSRALFDPKHHAWGNFSNIWFDYLRRLSPEVRKRWPDMRISTLAYMRHYGAPTFELPDNIDVMVAMMRTSMGNKEPEVFSRNLNDLRKWSQHLGGDRNRLFLWEYGCWPAFWVSPPILCPNAQQKWLREVRPLVSGVFFEMYEPNEYYFIMRRLWMRLLWNPDLDVNAEIEDLCGKFFGPAGQTMKAFYTRLTERYEMPWNKPRLTWDQYYLDDDLYFRQSYPPEEIERLAALLEKAKREAGLPAVMTKETGTGSAVHLTNASDRRSPVALTLKALKEAVVNPTISWDTGRLSWQGRLQPGQRLEVSAGGSAAIAAAGGERHDVVVSREGELPALEAGTSKLFRFSQAEDKSTEAFEVELRYGTDGGSAADGAEQSIYARRLQWLADAYQVLPPLHKLGRDPRNPAQKTSTRGFFADARAKHQKMGLVPSFAPPKSPK